VLRGSEENSGRTPGRPNRVVGVLAVTELRDEDPVGQGRGVPNQVELRGREDRNKITPFRQRHPYQTVIQRDTTRPGRRATGATTSTIPGDCDRPIDERKESEGRGVVVESRSKAKEPSEEARGGGG